MTKLTKTDVHRERAARELARRRLHHFVQRLHPDYHLGTFHKELCATIEDFYERIRRKESPRLILAVPPRHGKSTVSSIYGPAYFLGRYPDADVIVTAHTASLATDFSKQARDLVRSKPYQALFDARIHPDIQGAELWRTTEGGGYFAVGVGGAVIGKGGDLIVIDDPYPSLEEAWSPSYREKVWNWYQASIYSRLSPGGGIMVIAQRWHEDDLTGRLLKMSPSQGGDGDEFELISYPALTPDPSAPKGYRALHPERYDADKLLRIKAVTDEFIWEAMYQQNPKAVEDRFFSVDRVRFYDAEELPTELNYYQAWDLALGQKERHDWSVCTTVGVCPKGLLWLVDQSAYKLPADELARVMIAKYEQYYPMVMCGIEAGHIFQTMEPFLVSLAEELSSPATFTPLKVRNRDKVLRARPLQAVISSGKLRIPRPDPTDRDDPINALLEELDAFPSQGRVHDDRVDSLAWIPLAMDEITPARAASPGADPLDARQRAIIRKAKKRMRTKAWHRTLTP